jgi:hypothetical protein
MDFVASLMAVAVRAKDRHPRHAATAQRRLDVVKLLGSKNASNELHGRLSKSDWAHQGAIQSRVRRALSR